VKKEVNTKKLLFENMSKLNPDFKLNEGDDKWIQKAVDPEHKGYCTPMTKPTCTPQRKALAKRFKKGIENEGVNLNMLFQTNEYKKKANEIKAVIDKLFLEEDDEALDTLYRLLVRRTAPVKQATPQELQEIFDAIGRNENVEGNQELLNERLTTFASDIHREISKIPGLTRINFWSLANGFVGLYRYEKDGNAYEIEIRPVQVGTQKGLWGNQIKKREDRNGQR
jgi:hypothetical protein